ncbi:glycosyltransferase family 2 protein [uncultured Fibrella sp.]|uniref:glycosyltransferase family 2 protein n=1 Tax=uncultured Fibrella sp. TaxID=1284596 RepID=UPI0035CC806C
MQQLPLVSVVLATYNGERFLEAQLDSIVRQTYSNLEVVIVDDCSTDATPAILGNYANKYPFVRVVLNENNLGYVRNFEKGMLLATGDYIAPSDQDDIWHLDKISTLIAEIGDSDLVYADSRLIDEDGNSLNMVISDVKPVQNFDNCLAFAIWNTAPGHAMLITKELVRQTTPFPTSLPHDHWLCFVATFRKPIRFVPDVLVDYRQHSQNVFGITHRVDGVRRPRKQKTEEQKLREIRERIQLLYDKCPAELTEQKEVLARLNQSYKSFSLRNNYIRMMTFFQNRDKLLASKKRSAYRKWLFCLKMFVKIR